MVATFLQDDLVDELKRIFEHFQLYSASGERSEIHIYKQFVPITKPAEPPEEELDLEVVDENLAASEVENPEDPFPYIEVRLVEGEIKDVDGDQTVSVYLLIGVYDDHLDNQGVKDVFNVIQKIEERFSKNPILARRYECTYPMKWAMQEEESFPYFFGGLELKFIVHPIRREGPFI